MLPAQQAKMLRRSKKKNLMGRRGENCRVFTEELIFKLEQSGWNQLSTDHFGVLLWLEDLDTSDHDQRELANRIHESWHAANDRKETFTVLDCQRIALSF